MLRKFDLCCALNLGDVFDKVTRPCSIILACNSTSSVAEQITVGDLSRVAKPDKPTLLQEGVGFSTVPKRSIHKIPNCLLITNNPRLYEIWEKLLRVPHIKLRELTDDDGIQRGVSPDLKSAFIVDTNVASENELEREKLRPVITGGRHVKRYAIDSPDLRLIYTSRDDDFDRYPNITKFIDQFRDDITCKEVKQGKHSLYALHRPRQETIFLKKTKFVGVITDDEIIVAVDDRQRFATDGLYLFGLRDGVDQFYLLGILNSRLMTLAYRLLSLETGRVLAQVKPAILNILPISTVDGQPATEKLHSQISSLAERLCVLWPRANATRTTHTRNVIMREIQQAASTIDRFVYELYGLSDEEIRLVEEATT